MTNAKRGTQNEDQSLVTSAATNPTNTLEKSHLLAGRWRRDDVLRFPGLEVVVGLNNIYLATGHNVNLCPFSAWRRPGLTFANQSHFLPGNICQFVVGSLVNHFKFTESRRLLLFGRRGRT